MESRYYRNHVLPVFTEKYRTLGNDKLYFIPVASEIYKCVVLLLWLTERKT